MLATRLVQFLGIYYLITGLWGIIFLDSFIAIVWGMEFELHSRFMMHTTSAMFVVLGIFFFLTSKKQSTRYLAAAMTFAVCLVELWYIDHVSKGLLLIDVFVEGIIATILVIYSLKELKIHK